MTTLKSVNDTSLSDWQGVIGDEIAEQRKEKHEREQELQEMLISLEHDLVRQRNENGSANDQTSDALVEMEAIRKDIRLALSSISGVSIPFHRPARKPDVEAPCPACGHLLHFKQRNSPNSMKGLRCTACDAKLIARNSQELGPHLTLRLPVTEQYNCPSCGSQGTGEVDPLPGSLTTGVCQSCGEELNLLRVANSRGVRPSLRQISARVALTPEIVESVKINLPSQPWPTGVHKEVASKLDLKPTIVSEAIQALIKRGDVRPQENGVVF